jgi:predicted TPR repeat methyltransferase
MTVTDHFAGEVAARYDRSSGPYFDPSAIEATVDFLEPLGRDGALELAIGTGRIAVPLARRGVRVRGIDLSPAMVGELRKKTDAIPVVVGDMCTTRIDETFSLVYLVYSSIVNVTTQDRQVAAFATAAAHLEPRGCFVAEVEVPRLQRLPPGERYLTFAVSDNYVGFDEYHVAEQGLISHHQSTAQRLSVPCRYVWPSELDLMARLAGLELRERWADWDRSPFTAESTKHVSVWQKARG